MGNCARQVACLRIKLPLIVLLVNNSNKHLYCFEAAQASLANINLTFEDMNPLESEPPQLLSIQLHALNPFYLIFQFTFHVMVKFFSQIELQKVQFLASFKPTTTAENESLAFLLIA